MAKAKSGDTVQVHYTGTLSDGSVFDSSEGHDPLSFTLGENQVIPGFEEAVEGMEPGEKKRITIQADQAYGLYDEEMVLIVGRDEFPPDLELELGMRLQVRQADGYTFVVTVVEMDEKEVKLDANHPLAGEELTFDIELVDID